MTEQQEADLRAMSADIAGAETSPWEPRCVMQAFRIERAGELHLTMQGWADLEAMRSPLLMGELPEWADLPETARAFGLGEDLQALEGEDCAELARAMREACVRAFAMALPMEPPGRTAEPPAADGFGRWAPIFAALVTQCGLSVAEARAMRVDQAYVLIAAHRRNQGWHVAGTSYALRDLELTQPTEKEAARG